MNPELTAAPAGIVIIGASLAGLRAAEGARNAGWTGPITLIGAEPHLPYDRPPLSKAALDPDAPRSTQATPLRAAADLDDLNIKVLLGHRVTHLDPVTSTLTVGNSVGNGVGDGVGDGAGDGHLRYDRLIIATGCAPIPLPGYADQEPLQGVHTLRTHEDSQAVAALLDKGARTVVIGAGFIGSEIASAARKRGLPVAVVERLPVPLVRSLGTQPGEICADLHREAGTDLYLGRDVMRIIGKDGTVCGVQLDDGSVLVADLVVVGIGVRPATDWLTDSGIELHERDHGIVCTPDLRTSLPGVWAAGDVTHVPYADFDGDLMRLEHWTSAAEQGALAGSNAAASLMAPSTTEAPVDHAVGDTLKSIPYFWSDWYGHRIQFIGTPKADEVLTLGPHGPGAIVLYRRGDRVAGILTIDRPRDIMKFRKLVMQPDSWDKATSLAHERLVPA